ncbi:MAG TPA: HAMP domain-containing sensor histidine kinase [Ruminococcus flavefaciens]|mgnify:FL=1|nr:HAMP domain-containing sensor histidine kinase [Ruminococcus flavefaciens]
MWRIAAIAAIICCMMLVVYLLALKRQMRNITDELDRTAKRSYNRLVRIPLFDNDLNSLTSAINREIDDRKRMKIKSEETEKALRQAISDIAHDLRTPLSVIKGELQIMNSNSDNDPEQKNYIDVCIRKTDELKNMADGFFELALLESRDECPELKRINVTNLLMQFIAENEGLIRLNDLEPEIIFPDSTVFAMGDEEYLKRILGNLLGNVIKYSSGSFTLRLTDNGEISIANPVGNAEAIDTERIFDRSYRADPSRKSGSAGLGLYIVRLLCDKISAEASASADTNSLTVTIKLRPVIFSQ